jgi:hypothetical protein
MAFLCVSQQGEFKKEIQVKNFLPRSRGGGGETFFLSFPPSIYLKHAFGVSLRAACCTLRTAHCALIHALELLSYTLG